MQQIGLRNANTWQNYEVYDNVHPFKSYASRVVWGGLGADHANAANAQLVWHGTTRYLTADPDTSDNYWLFASYVYSVAAFNQTHVVESRNELRWSEQRDGSLDTSSTKETFYWPIIQCKDSWPTLEC